MKIDCRIYWWWILAFIKFKKKSQGKQEAKTSDFSLLWLSFWVWTKPLLRIKKRGNKKGEDNKNNSKWSNSLLHKHFLCNAALFCFYIQSSLLSWKNSPLGWLMTCCVKTGKDKNTEETKWRGFSRRSKKGNAGNMGALGLHGWSNGLILQEGHYRIDLNLRITNMYCSGLYDLTATK